jgi:hypothetical protein
VYRDRRFIATLASLCVVRAAEDHFRNRGFDARS